MNFGFKVFLFQTFSWLKYDLFRAPAVLKPRQLNLKCVTQNVGHKLKCILPKKKKTSFGEWPRIWAYHSDIVVRKVPSDVSWSIWGLSSIWRIIFTTSVKSWVLCIVRKLQHLNSIQYCILLHPGHFLVFSSRNFSTLDNLLHPLLQEHILPVRLIPPSMKMIHRVNQILLIQVYLLHLS